MLGFLTGGKVDHPMADIKQAREIVADLPQVREQGFFAGPVAGRQQAFDDERPTAVSRAAAGGCADLSACLNVATDLQPSRRVSSELAGS